MKKDYKVLLYPANGKPFWAYYLYDTLAKARDYAQEIVKGWDEKDPNRKVKSEIYAGEEGGNYFPTLVETYHWKKENNALSELAEEMKEGLIHLEYDTVPHWVEVYGKAQRIVAELAKVNHGEASPTPWRAHTDREVRANDERLWIKDVVCQTQSCPKTRYTKSEREEWNIPATANTKLIVASVNAVAKCRAIAEEGANDGK